MIPDFDPAKAPEAIRPVVVLSGSYYDMGVQYGQQAKEIIARNAVVVKSQVAPMWKDWSQVDKVLNMYEEFVQEKTPEIVELWKGIAEGAGVEYNDIRIINLSLQLIIMPLSESAVGKKMNACSNVSAWGDATKDGKMITGANLDQMWNSGGYSVVILAFPENGNNFITTPAWGGEVVGNFGMNDEGLVTLGSGGQDYSDGDMKVSYPNFYAKFAGLISCATVDEAVDKYLSLECGTAENAHFADIKSAKIVEYTPAHHVVRVAGDHGETDCIYATNHFVSEEMQSSIYPDKWASGYYCSVPRYATYKKQLEDGCGHLDVKRIMEIMSGHDYWDGDIWHEDVYSLLPEEDPASSWSIEMRSVNCKTLMRGIAVPEDRAVYLMNGQADCRMSTIPEATGNYCKLTLYDDIQSVLDGAIDEAELQIWFAGKELNLREYVLPERDRLFEDARKAIWTGFNYRAIGDVLEDRNEKLENYGKALTWFCKAQTYAQKAAGKGKII